MKVSQRTKQVAAAAMALLLAISPAWADDAALYSEAPPADAVFVRLLAEHGAPARSVAFGGTTFPVREQNVDTYVAISAAEMTGITAGTYYSLADGHSGPQVIEEPARETAAKVHLILVNTSPEPVRLIVPEAGMEVVAALPSGKAASQAVNPVAVTLAVERISDGAIMGMFDVSLSRGQNLTFVANTSAARMIENSFGPVLTIQ